MYVTTIPKMELCFPQKIELTIKNADELKFLFHAFNLTGPNLQEITSLSENKNIYSPINHSNVDTEQAFSEMLLIATCCNVQLFK